MTNQQWREAAERTLEDIDYTSHKLQLNIRDGLLWAIGAAIISLSDNSRHFLQGELLEKGTTRGQFP